jgi:hypothetical protein
MLAFTQSLKKLLLLNARHIKMEALFCIVLHYFVKFSLLYIVHRIEVDLQSLFALHVT